MQKGTKISRVSPDEFSCGSICGSPGFMIKTGSGKSILTEPFDVAEGVKADIITMSHSRFDQIDNGFIDNSSHYKISRYAVETVTHNDVDSQGINLTVYQTGHWSVDKTYLDALEKDRVVVFLPPRNGAIID